LATAVVHTARWAKKSIPNAKDYKFYHSTYKKKPKLECFKPNMPFCSSCGTQISDIKFCTSCGAQQQQVAALPPPYNSNAMMHQKQPMMNQQQQNIAINVSVQKTDGVGVLDPVFTGCCCKCFHPVRSSSLPLSFHTTSVL
jgi:hypothetical protein